jgi:Uma2 family endonuclease
MARVNLETLARQASLGGRFARDTIAASWRAMPEHLQGASRMSTIPAMRTDQPVVPGDILYEVVGGQVLEKTMGSFETGIASILFEILGPFARSHRLGQLFNEMLFRINIAEDLQRRPDVAFVSDARWPINRRPPRDAVWEMVPDLTIEVISKSNSAFDVLKKLHEYFDAGVRRVWVIYPEQAEVYDYSNPKQVQILGVGQELEGGELLPGFRVPVAALFEDDPE